jgi:hypothetical protein
MRIQFYVSFISAIYASIKLNPKQFKSNESVREAFQESLGFSPFELVLNTMWEVTFASKMPL